MKTLTILQPIPSYKTVAKMRTNRNDLQATFSTTKQILITHKTGA